jgi:hypothetical protein
MCGFCAVRMTPEEFRNQIATLPDADVLRLCLRNDLLPYVFEAQPNEWANFRNRFSTVLNVAPDNVAIIGSGRFGFSLKPSKPLRPFSDTSDIDVVVVDANHFDALWANLLHAAYPREANVARLGGWLRDRRNEVYTGWLSPLKVRLDRTIFGTKAQPVLDFNTRWFNLLKEASRITTCRHQGITGRLYRTWQHAELYHLHSLQALKRALNPP